MATNSRLPIEQGFLPVAIVTSSGRARLAETALPHGNAP
jgi:hypothetical protein